MYVSDTSGLVIVDESNWRDHVRPRQDNPDGMEQSDTGFIPRDWHAQPLGSGPATTAFPQHLLLDEKQAKERIEELERTKTDIVSLLTAAWQAAKFICLNQDPTNYCWCYAVIHAIMIQRLLAGEPFRRLSPFSVAAIVKNFRNIGGWGSQANAQCVKEGVCDESVWPMEKPGMSSSERRAANMNAINNGRQYLAGSRANAKLHIVTEFWDLRPRNWQEKLSALCIPTPVASGYNWMGHERCSVKAVVLSNGDTGCVDLDSYTQDGSPDLKVLNSSRGAADDGVVPRVITPSNE